MLIVYNDYDIFIYKRKIPEKKEWSKKEVLFTPESIYVKCMIMLFVY